MKHIYQIRKWLKQDNGIVRGVSNPRMESELKTMACGIARKLNDACTRDISDGVKPDLAWGGFCPGWLWVGLGLVWICVGLV